MRPLHPAGPCANYTNFPELDKNSIMAGCAGRVGLDWPTLKTCGTGPEVQSMTSKLLLLLLLLLFLKIFLGGGLSTTFLSPVKTAAHAPCDVIYLVPMLIGC